MLFNRKRERCFIVKERAVTTVIKAVNSYRKTTEMEVGLCNDENDEGNWFVSFMMNDKRYARVIGELKEIGKFYLESVDDEVFTYFEIDKEEP